MMTDEDNVTESQDLFCQFYTQLSDTYGNGTWSYALAFGHDLANAPKDDAVWDDDHKNILEKSSYSKMENVCAVGASRLLRDDKIIGRIRDLKAAHFNDDKIVDSRVLDIIQKGKDTDALAAIRHRNEIKQRVVKKIEGKVEGELKVALVEFMSDDEDT
jgi:hypothetical protein